MSKQINLIVDQGTTFSHIFDVLNPDGTPFDLTGFTAYSQMKKSYFTSTFHNLTVSVEGAARRSAFQALPQRAHGKEHHPPAI